MNTIEKLREIAELLASQKKYSEAYTIYEELYKQLWGVFGMIQNNLAGYSNNYPEMRIGPNHTFRIQYVEPAAHALCARIYQMKLSLVLNEFIRILYGHLQCICYSLPISQETIPSVVLSEFIVLYTLALQPAQQRRISPIFSIVTAIIDGNKKFRRIRSNYPRNIIENLLIENALKCKNSEWKTINCLLCDFLFNIGDLNTVLYKKLTSIAGSYSYRSYHKQYRTNPYGQNSRYERFEHHERYKYERFERNTAFSSKYFSPSTATEEEKKEYYGQLIGLSGIMTKAQVRSKYLNLISLYHPDKVQHLGPELKQLAELKTKEINAAYDWLKTKYHI